MSVITPPRPAAREKQTLYAPLSWMTGSLPSEELVAPASVIVACTRVTSPCCSVEPIVYEEMCTLDRALLTDESDWSAEHSASRAAVESPFCSALRKASAAPDGLLVDSPVPLVGGGKPDVEPDVPPPPPALLSSLPRNRK